MKIIDGSKGEGGGQIFRSSLSLAMCTQTPVRIENIRAGRKKPGLLRQHLACLRSSKEICNARVTGDELGSACVEFIPGDIVAGKYHCAIGTAGSTSLIFQTILPALLQADAESEVTLEGGTHNQAAPSFEFIQHCFISVLNRMNIKIEAVLDKYGFYPNGGGAWRVKISPTSEVYPLKLLERGELQSHQAVAMSSRIPEHVTDRELKYIQRKLKWQGEELEQKLLDSFGPGNLVSLQVRFQKVTEVFDSVGAVGLSAERVAGRCVRDLKRYLSSEAVVGEYLCDQLLLPMALGSGGVFTTLSPSLHSRTNIEIIKKFIDCDISIKEIDADLIEIRVTV